MHTGSSAIDDSVARDRIPVGADIDGIAGRAKDFVAGNGNAVTEVRAIMTIGEQDDGKLAIADSVA